MSTPLALRNTVARLNAQAQRDLATVWRRVESAAQAGEALRDVLPALIDTYGLAASAAAAEWYDSLREKAEARGRFVANPVQIADTGAPALIGWASSTAADDTAFRSLIAGGMQRRIANHSRATVTQSSIADPAAAGWQRVGSGECAFCAMLIGRGTVYTEAGADFASHDHCNCSAIPAFGGQPLPVKPYTPTSRNITDADRARVREYLASH